MSNNGSAQKWYWIAINGGHLSLSYTPWREPTTRPVAEQLIGFPTLAEAQEAQRVWVHEPTEVMHRFFRSLEPEITAGRVQLIRPSNREMATSATMYWRESEVPMEHPADVAFRWFDEGDKTYA